MFITYNDLDDMRDTRKRSQINAFVNRGRKANRVKSAQRQARAVQWQSQHPIRSATPIKIESELSTPNSDIVDFRHSEFSKEVINALLKRRRLPKFAIQYGLGGIRRDPFASFPITQTEQIDRATDFCEFPPPRDVLLKAMKLVLQMLMCVLRTVTQNYSAMNASLYTDEAGNWLMNTLFPMALQSDMLFEALLLSMARYFSPTSKDALVPGGTHFVYLRSSVLGKLHRTLSLEEEVSTSDTTIHTVICLIAADFFAGYDDHAATHLKGLQTLVSLRGGLEHGNFDRYTKFNLAGTHALCQFAEQRLRGSKVPAVVVEPEFTYPSHPFSPELCTEIAILPLGLSDVALDGKISEQIIALLCRISKMAQDSPLTKNATTEQIYNASVDLLTYVTRTNILPLERSICIFTFILFIRETPNRNDSQRFFGQFLTTFRQTMTTVSETFLSLDGVNADLAIWGVAMFAIENSPEKIGLDEEGRSDLFAQLVQMYPQAANWKFTWKSLKRFYFLDTWMEEYRTWWTKEVEKHRKRPRESQ
ncbi:hypothetical protein H2200_007141 [Cladophialophora chaetospira]|uniref:Uncharacterized protein n=1 Tax=Cladophialophora chaetospira TaxID=386627 RepID=A0AA38X7T7_9EURO|nr:hypothetical protein H2200_007141 [Cladophialophora chaetospira]